MNEDPTEGLERLEDQKINLEFVVAEARGKIEWVSNEVMAKFVDQIVVQA